MMNLFEMETKLGSWLRGAVSDSDKRGKIGEILAGTSICNEPGNLGLLNIFN